jgi:hypothetical protein
LKPFKIKPGETVFITIEWNFSNEAHSKDWSITCNGDGAKDTLHLTHDMGMASDSWEPTVRQEPKPVKVTPPPPPAPTPDTQSEAVFRKFVEGVKVEGNDCSMLKEDKVNLSGGDYFFRAAIRNDCNYPVSYLVSMYAEDWVTNMDQAYPVIDVGACINIDKTENVIACLVTLDKKNPITGWQLLPGSYGIHAANKCDADCITK